jgi:hypothetical protein
MITAVPFPPNHRKPYTLAFQAESAKELAMSAWQARWRQSPRQSQVSLALPAPLKRKPASIIPLEASSTPPPPSSAWSPDMSSSAHTPPDSIPVNELAPRDAGKPPDGHERHQTLPALRKSLSCPPPPDSPWLISVNPLRHQRWQGPPSLLEGQQSLLQPVRGGLRPGDGYPQSHNVHPLARPLCSSYCSPAPNVQLNPDYPLL